jgi:hypothetical protein
MILDKTKVPVSGRVSIVVRKDSEIVNTVQVQNAVIVDLLRVIISQLVPKNTSTSAVIDSDGRPDIILNQSTGPTNSNTLAYIRAGYSTQQTQLPPVSKTDTAMFSQTFDTMRISKSVVTENSITVTASKSVSELDSLKLYTEVGLYTAGSANSNLPEVPNNTGMLLMAHQIHSQLTAPVGSTIEYEWTLLFQE